MSEHTPEPWKIANNLPRAIVQDLGLRSNFEENLLWVDAEGYPVLGNPEDARRIVACVNACAGMDDPVAEIARLKAELAEAERKGKELCIFAGNLGIELSEARRIIRNLDNHNYAFVALKAQAHDFLAKHPEADPPS